MSQIEAAVGLSWEKADMKAEWKSRMEIVALEGGDRLQTVLAEGMGREPVDQSSMMPRFNAIVTACVRSFAPSFESTPFMWPFTVPSVMAR